MGLLQNIEGLFGFGKKVNQTAQNARAIDDAIAKTEAWMNATQAFVEAVKPFASENAVFAAAIAAEEIGEADAQAVLSWLKSLVPPAPPKTS
jgi:hypothetical protein